MLGHLTGTQIYVIFKPMAQTAHELLGLDSLCMYVRTCSWGLINVYIRYEAYIHTFWEIHTPARQVNPG